MYPHLSYGHEHTQEYDSAKGQLLRLVRRNLLWKPDFYFRYEEDLFRHGTGEDLYLRVAADEDLERTKGVEGRLMRLVYSTRDHVACLDVPSHLLELGISCLRQRPRKAILDTIFDRRLHELIAGPEGSHVLERIRGLFDAYNEMLNS